MAQTLNYLTEHGPLDYAGLTTKADEVTGSDHKLSDKIKAVEKRMAEIVMLKTHIINYSKTYDTYVAYRKAWDEMTELLTVQTNVQKLLGRKEQEQEKAVVRREDERCSFHRSRGPQTRQKAFRRNVRPAPARG